MCLIFLCERTNWLFLHLINKRYYTERKCNEIRSLEIPVMALSHVFIWDIIKCHTEEAMAPHSILLPGKSHGRRSLVGYSPWGCEESDTTRVTSLSLFTFMHWRRNGNPLQCSCLENPRDGEPGGLPSMGLHRVGHD